MRAWLLVCVGCIYGPHSFGDGAFPGKRVELPCLDLAVGLTEDPRAEGKVVEYSFGNRCWHPVVVDLGSVRAVGRFADGRVVQLAAYDPKHEIVPLPIDGLWQGRELIDYTSVDSAMPDALCVEVGHVDRTTAGSVHWVCMGLWEVTP